MEMRQANKNMEFLLKACEEGVLIEMYKKVSAGKLILLDYKIGDLESFQFLKSALINLSELEEGILLYDGKMKIGEVCDYLKNLGFKVGCVLVSPEVSKEERIKSLQRRLERFVIEEDYLEAAKLRDKIIELKN